MFGRSDDAFWRLDMTQFEALCDGHARYHGQESEQTEMSHQVALMAMKRASAGRKRDGRRVPDSNARA